MVPAAIGADLHGVDPKLAMFAGHLLDLFPGLDPPRVLTQFIAERIAELDQLFAPTDGALASCGFAVEFGRSS
ncbi:hypothetical protein GALL_454880 [mine drainage metagenome]|uniref:Uncharacterized protein n=1 Tax=mine drainage metagenome TaxID=410659 RepID=A0A1J5PYJ6_9ZZZZ